MTNNTSLLFLCSSAQPHITQLQSFLKQQSAWGTPDLHILNSDEDLENFSTLPIERVRELIGEMSLRPYQADRSTYVITHIDQASIPAQNALLKSLEEPPAHAQIILTCEQLENVLPTIRSRCVIEKIIDNKPVTVDTQKAEEVLTKISKGKMGDVFEISEQYKDRETALILMNQLVMTLHKRNEQHPTATTTKQLQKFLTAKSLLQKNVNVRLVLENAFFETVL